ncbi:MAG: DUF169 domain-containing protein [Candidatus Zixiibacteriota bacterium]|nr:MAG: DUF169 domain-containing protein [candidate division Zixibacteria bacterium]
MDIELKRYFIERWAKYFPRADLPISFYYADSVGDIEMAARAEDHRCIIGDLARVRKGRSLAFDLDTVGCGGGRRYLGFTHELMPDFEYFLSCGIEGKLEGERYKKSPELVKQHLEHSPPFEAPARYAVFKRFDRLDEADQPLVAIFFVTPDQLAGLYTLVNFDEGEPNGVIAPMGAGCATIVQMPYQELASRRPRAVLGMFDVSARPYVPGDRLTLAVPWPKFAAMVSNMDESFLITESWAKVRNRMASTHAATD